MINEQIDMFRKYNKEWHILQSKERAKNGFTHAPNIWQLISALIYVLVCSHYFVMVSYMEGQYQRIGFVVTEVVIAVVVFGSWVVASAIDPADSTHAQHWKSILQQTQFKKPEHRLMCPICQTYRSIQSFHCKKCNKCIQKFDHHCKWINNCVGFKNYLEFLILLISLIIFLAFNSGVIIFYLIDQLAYQGTPSAFTIISIVMCVLDVIGLALIATLFVFHVVLICTGKRTISFILDLRRTNKEEQLKSDTEKTQGPINRKFDGVLAPIGLYSASKAQNDGNIQQKKRVQKNLQPIKIKKISLIKPNDNQPKQRTKSRQISKK